ncbi:hypothetical protein [Hoylesella enoeca]|uniref:hypothetical protein n=1 Tax=Hoylesella enoeca TaxID=76123 RepID=UPI00131ED99A|nr:hypothetical protein [Hoylesella enoeca]
MADKVPMLLESKACHDDKAPCNRKADIVGRHKAQAIGKNALSGWQTLEASRLGGMSPDMAFFHQYQPIKLKIYEQND